MNRTLTFTRPHVSAMASADAVLKAKGRSFHWARRLLGTQHARNATRLYAFCRLLDDIADEAASSSQARERLEAIAASVVTGRTDDPALLDALDLIHACRIEPAIVLELIGGVASDLGTVRIADEAALLRYCYRVAGTVGLMMCGALDVVDPAAFPHAVDLGIGMQITNICRDVVEDAAAGRRYLPATLLGDVAPRDLINPSAMVRQRLRSCVKTLLDRADEHYRSGERGISYLPLRARAGILAASHIYHAIGDRLRERDYAVWDGRVIVGPVAKLSLTASALVRVVTGPSDRRHSIPHDATLHDELIGFPGLSKIRHGC